MKTHNLLLPVLPLRDIVVFPHMIVPLFVGREKSVQALEEVMKTEYKQILLVTQKNSGIDAPGTDDLYNVGTVGTMLQLLRLPDGTVKVLVEGVERAEILSYNESEPFMRAVIQPIHETIDNEQEIEALQRTVTAHFEQYVKLNRKIPPEVLVTVSQIDDPAKLADTIASYFTLKIADKQNLLETAGVNKRLEAILNIIEGESAVLQVERRIRTRVKRQMEKSQREYYLNEQMKAIQKELNEGEDGKDEFAEYGEKIEKLKLPAEVKEKATAELKKLRMMNAAAAESTVVRNYLDWLLGIPWKHPAKVKNDLIQAQKVLDKDHYGLEKVKERILEYLAVQARVKKIKGQILCLVGPPGVGKTSLGQSIAKATGRSFVRISLGGVRDEAEIRGHRRTYIAAMPGKIIQAMKKAKSTNPLILLDEIDKLGQDWRGDPASALLEVLDTEQNTAFNDHYLEVDYDLSDVMFITTANTLNMPQPLLDRMEVIRLSGYTEEEKVHIAMEHLVPKHMELHGLKAKEWSIGEDAMRVLVRRYTREAGVRNLEREIAKLTRKAVKEIDSKKTDQIEVSPLNLEHFAGVPRFSYGKAEEESTIGVVTGLAWTEVGGEILSIEAVAVQGKGKLLITGKLGDVMQESAQAAMSYIRSKAAQLDIAPELFEQRDIHIHVPEGATPKDGPSAGIAIACAIASALTNRKVNRGIAMTGEITLRGRVLQIGGLKEKLLAAHRAGIETVLIPLENKKDLAEIPQPVLERLQIKPVSGMDEVLDLTLSKV